MLTAERKLPRLCELLRRHYDEGQILVFVDTQEACDILFRELLKQQLPCTVLHGGMGQAGVAETSSPARPPQQPRTHARAPAAFCTFDAPGLLSSWHAQT